MTSLEALLSLEPPTIEEANRLTLRLDPPHGETTNAESSAKPEGPNRKEKKTRTSRWGRRTLLAAIQAGKRKQPSKLERKLNQSSGREIACLPTRKRCGRLPQQKSRVYKTNETHGRGEALCVQRSRSSLVVLSYCAVKRFLRGMVCLYLSHHTRTRRYKYVRRKR